MMAQLGEWRGIKHGMKSAALAWRGMLEGTINSERGEHDGSGNARARACDGR